MSQWCRDPLFSVIVCCGRSLQFVINPSLLLSSCQASDGVFDVVDWDMWFYGTGMPTYTPQ